MSHTKGEWKQYAPKISGKVDQTYRTIETADKPFHDDESGGFSLMGYINESDARLIAAAPDLLEALERVNHTLTLHGKVDVNTDLHKFLLNAIQKAKGE